MSIEYNKIINKAYEKGAESDDCVSLWSETINLGIETSKKQDVVLCIEEMNSLMIGRKINLLEDSESNITHTLQCKDVKTELLYETLDYNINNLAKIYNIDVEKAKVLICDILDRYCNEEYINLEVLEE